ADHIGHERRRTVVLALQPVVFDHDILPIDVAGIAQAFAERSRIARGGSCRPAVEKTHHWHRGLLRARCERPRRRLAAGKRDELAQLHSISASASSTNESGIVSAIALAAFRLTINS